MKRNDNNIKKLLKQLEEEAVMQKIVLNKLINSSKMHIIPINIDHEKNEVFDWSVDTEINPDFELWEKELNE